MFHQNDTILYGAEGVYRIEDITEMDFKDEKMEYYVLKSLLNGGETIFVPSKNEELRAKMRRVLSTEEIYQVIEEMPNQTMVWIDDEKSRMKEYKEIIMKGNHKEIVKLIKSLYLHRQDQRAIGKNLHKIDERFLKDAEKLLYDEFAYVLQIKPEQVLPFIQERMEKEEKKNA